MLTVESFEPLSSLARLQHLELFGIQPATGGLQPLFSLIGLESARISVMPEDDVQEFFERTGADDSISPEPAFAE